MNNAEKSHNPQKSPLYYDFGYKKLAVSLALGDEFVNYVSNGLPHNLEQGEWPDNFTRKQQDYVGCVTEVRDFLNRNPKATITGVVLEPTQTTGVTPADQLRKALIEQNLFNEKIPLLDDIPLINRIPRVFNSLRLAGNHVALVILGTDLCAENELLELNKFINSLRRGPPTKSSSFRAIFSPISSLEDKTD